jgi:hypothetical protein
MYNIYAIVLSHLPKKTSGACTSSHSISSIQSGPNETAAVEPTILSAALIVANITKQNPGYSVAANRVTLNQLLLHTNHSKVTVVAAESTLSVADTAVTRTQRYLSV